MNKPLGYLAIFKMMEEISLRREINYWATTLISKMNRIPILFFFALFFLFQNCGNKESLNSTISTKNIKISRDFLTEDVSEFIPEKLDTINLELPGNPPLTTIQDLVFSQNFFLLLDRKQGLLKFDNNGKFLLKIGEFGEWPDEYAMPYAVQLDEKKNIVYVADWQKMVILTIASKEILNQQAVNFQDIQSPSIKKMIHFW